MNDVSNTESLPNTVRRPGAVRTRTYRAAIHDTGASRLTTDELAIITQALVILENKVVRKLKPDEILTNPQRVKQWLILHYGMLDREVFGLVFLDARHRYLGHQQLFHGDIQGASVHPRQVARSVFAYNAAAVIAIHCHPLCFVESVRRRGIHYNRGHFVRSRSASSIAFAMPREGVH